MTAVTLEPEVDKQQAYMLEEISNYVITGKYARYIPEKKRRETWEEAIDRVLDMHLDKYSHLHSDDLWEIIKAFKLVKQKVVGGSMRSVQFGGKAQLAANARGYNCCVRHIDSIRSFAEIFYLLLCGCGVGIGLTDKYLGRLPNLVTEDDRTGTVITYVVEDNIEGWADSLEALLNCYFVNTAYSGRKIIFDYSRIRPAGSILKTGGGKAPGHEGLKAAHAKIKKMMDSIIEEKGQRRLSSVDAMDIACHASDAVLSGGVRRSALSTMFSKDDEAMINAKTGDWFKENPQRARSNNSVLLLRDEISYDEFLSIYERTREWGEPGFVFADDPDALYNPCFEVAFVPVTDDGVCGVQFCNLSTINAGKTKTEEEFYEAARAAAIIGTLQAGYTDFPYLSNTAKELTEKESLLGVSMTAMFENPEISTNPDIQKRAAKIVVDTNEEWAAKIGINPAARCTVIKPEGTSTLAFGSMWSGIHPAHAPVMFRRIQANKMDNVYNFFKMHNPGLTEPSVYSANNTDDVITFPVELNPDGIFKGDLTALEHLEIIKSTQQNWVVPGTTKYNTKDVHHNVSCTVIVQDDEWNAVAEYLYENRDEFSAVSLLPASGDKDYAQAPNEAIVTAEDFQKFDQLLRTFTPVDYTQMIESEDGTALQQEASCYGGACETV